MTRLPRAGEHAETGDAETPFHQSLATGNTTPLTSADVQQLVVRIDEEFPVDDVSQEIAALRLILLRLLTEYHDLPSLATHVTRVVTVMLQGVRTNHRVRRQGAADLLDAVTTVLAEIGNDR